MFSVSPVTYLFFVKSTVSSLILHFRRWFHPTLLCLVFPTFLLAVAFAFPTLRPRLTHAGCFLVVRFLPRCCTVCCASGTSIHTAARATYRPLAGDLASGSGDGASTLSEGELVTGSECGGQSDTFEIVSSDSAVPMRGVDPQDDVSHGWGRYFGGRI